MRIFSSPLQASFGVCLSWAAVNCVSRKRASLITILTNLYCAFRDNEGAKLWCWWAAAAIRLTLGDWPCSRQIEPWRKKKAPWWEPLWSARWLSV